MPFPLELEGTVAKRPEDTDNITDSLILQTTGFILISNMSERSGSSVLTEAPVTGELLVDLFHALDVEAAGFCVVHHGLRVVDSNNTLGCLLYRLRSVPGIIDVLGWKPSQNGEVASEGGDQEV